MNMRNKLTALLHRSLKATEAQSKNCGPFRANKTTELKNITNTSDNIDT